MRSNLIPSVHTVCTKCALVKSASSMHTVCNKYTSIHENNPHPTRFGKLALGAAGLPWHSNHSRLQDGTRHITVLKYQRRGCTHTRATTQQKRVPRKQTHPTRFGSAAVSKASKAPKLRQTSRSYTTSHVPKVSAPWMHSNKHHNTANMGAVMNNPSDLGWFH